MWPFQDFYCLRPLAKRSETRAYKEWALSNWGREATKVKRLPWDQREMQYKGRRLTSSLIFSSFLHDLRRLRVGAILIWRTTYRNNYPLQLSKGFNANPIIKIPYPQFRGCVIRTVNDTRQFDFTVDTKSFITLYYFIPKHSI